MKNAKAFVYTGTRTENREQEHTEQETEKCTLN